MKKSEALAIIGELERRVSINKEAASYRWCPHDPTPKQQEFLSLDCAEALYGGSAGGGKSDALLMGALQYVHRRDYAAIIFRRTYKDLALPGAIMDRCKEWLMGSPAKWTEDTKTWAFPTGATITFGYLEAENDKFRYQSSEFQYIAFDELTQFSSSQYLYLFSRLRRGTSSSVPLRMRSASNPGGRGHKWVKERFVDEKTREGVFIPAALVDNPHVDQDSYIENLEKLDPITQKQLKDGVWIMDESLLVYKYKKERNLVAERPRYHPVSGLEIEWLYIWVIDFGGSERSATEATAILAFAYDLDEVYVCETRKVKSQTLDQTHEQYLADRRVYGGFFRVLADQGGLGNKFSRELQIRFSMPVMPCEKSEKLGNRKLLNTELEQGRLLVMAGKNDTLTSEYDELLWNDKGTDCAEGQDDHASDAVLYGWREARASCIKPQERKPKPGTPEYYKRESEEMQKRAAARIKAKNKTAFWEMQ
jgi:hypothetical protein